MGYRVEICGNIASGKTTLCQKFQGRKFLPIFEEFQKNPFYEDFSIKIPWRILSKQNSLSYFSTTIQ